MTREDLLDIIAFDEGMEDSKKVYDALRAVVELHKPIDDNSCHHCATWYPCPTVQAIEKKLQ